MSEPKKRGRPPKPKEVETADPNNVEEVATEIVKKKRTIPSDIEGASNAKATEISRTLKHCLQWYAMPKVKSVDELKQRTYDFFTTCINRGEIPTWEKYCLSTGYYRQTLWDWVTGVSTSELGSEANDIVKKAKDFLAAFESEMATNGKINPVVYIFRAKNFFGMKDQQEYVLTPNQPLGTDSDPTTIAQKYKSELPPPTIESKDIDS